MTKISTIRDARRNRRDQKRLTSSHSHSLLLPSTQHILPLFPRLEASFTIRDVVEMDALENGL